MPKFEFIPETDERLRFVIEGDTFKDAADGLEFELQMHDEWKVVPHPYGEESVDLYLKGHYQDTLKASELPGEEVSHA